VTENVTPITPRVTMNPLLEPFFTHEFWTGFGWGIAVITVICGRNIYP
jgi:hypothetical protein